MIIGKEEQFKKIATLVLKRLVASAILFFVPLFVSLLLTKIGEINDNKLACYEEASIANIQKLEKKEVDEIIANIDSNDIKLSDINKLSKKISRISNKSVKENYEKKAEEIKKKYNKQEEEKAKKEEEEKQKNKKKKKKTVLIGDSRTNRMCRWWKLCEDSEYVSLGGTAYTWFVNEAIPKINTKIKNNDYNIIILMGVNDLGRTSSFGASIATKYYNKVVSLARNEWKNQNIIYASIGPLVDGQGITTVAVNSFNRTMKQKISSSGISNLSYCDVYSSLQKREIIDYKDGIHYTQSGSKKIYQSIKNNCLK